MVVKVIFQNGGRRHLGFFGSEIWRHRKSRAARIYLHTTFGEDVSKGGRVMAIYVFSKWRSAAVLDFGGSEIWKYFCFRDVGFSLCAKFYANMWNCDRVMAVKVIFQNGGCPPSWIIIWLSWTTHEVFLLTWSLCSNFVPIEHFASLA